MYDVVFTIPLKGATWTGAKVPSQGEEGCRVVVVESGDDGIILCHVFCTCVLTLCNQRFFLGATLGGGGITRSSATFSVFLQNMQSSWNLAVGSVI
jgi:hypothetical protein